MKLFTVASALLIYAVTATEASPSKKPTTVLKTAASPRYFGAALGLGHLTNSSDPQFRSIAAAEFDGVTPENEMKWETIEPTQNNFNFTASDQIRDFAKSHGFVLRAHTLVWHSQLAPFVSTLNGTDLLHAMKNHITNVAGHYRGQVYAWDVVNEAFNDDGTLRESPFLTQIGDSYIETAFQTARKADPFAKLYYNDYNIEGINDKSTAVLALVKSLRKKGLIDGVGFQSHFIVGSVPSDLQANIERFNEAGVEVALTELDIRGTVPLSDADIAQHVKDYAFVTNACVTVKGCVGITSWGITDSYSWIPDTFAGQGYGLLWDENYVKKPAYYSTLAALKAH